MTALRIAFFGSPSNFSLAVLEQMTEHQQVSALVVPRSGSSPLRRLLLRLRGLRPPSALEQAAVHRGIPVLALDFGRRAHVVEELHRLRPDLICIALFPGLVPRDIIDLAPLGAINVHPSLLPRHRGPLPLFWTYHADDREAGVTVHHASQRFDAGDIVLQEILPLPRAYPVAYLDADVARCGAALLRSAVAALASGKAARVKQDESAATYAPRVKPGSAMVDFAQWDVERVWHFLAGLCPRFREPLVDGTGRPVRYQSVAGFQHGTALTPGTIETDERGWKLHCRGGIVQLSERA
jgi:methionyl-tRNA formyltransferase